METPEHYTVEIDRVSAAAWHTHLQDFSDANIYQTWSYGETRWGLRNLSHLVFKTKEKVSGLAQLRIVRTPFIGSGVAYLRWGPLFHQRCDEPVEEHFRRLLGVLQKEYVQARGHALRIIPNAFSDTPRAQLFNSILRKSGFQTLNDSPLYRTIVVDLTPSLEEIRRRLEQKWRNQLNQSERNSLTVIEGTDLTSWKLLETLYCGMMARKRFDTTISIKEFATIQASLPPELKLRVFIAKADGEPVAGIACSLVGDTGIYLLGATNEKALKLRAANLLQWAAIKRLKQLGLQSYDLGGIDPEANPGGFHFKQGMSGQDVTQLPAFDFCRSSGQRLMLRTTFKVASALRAWKIRQHKHEVAAN